MESFYITLTLTSDISFLAWASFDTSIFYTGDVPLELLKPMQQARAKIKWLLLASKIQQLPFLLQVCNK